MTIGNFIFIGIFIFSIVFLIRNLLRLKSYLKVAKKEDRSNNPGLRIWNMLKIAIFQSKIFRDFNSGLLHALIFWGFLVFLFSAAESVIQGFYGSFSLSVLKGINIPISFSTDILSAVLIIAILISFTRRYIIKIPRLQGDKAEKIDAFIVLGSIFIIVTSMFLMNAALSTLNPYEQYSFRPLAKLASGLFDVETAFTVYRVGWWIHILTILGFANYLPYSKHLHVYTSIPNVFFSSLTPVNKLEKINFEEEGVEKFGVIDINDLTWKNIFDSYSCTHCGRCSSVCPANITGKELSPREIIVQTRRRTLEAATAMLKVNEDYNYVPTEKEKSVLDKKFIGDYQSVEALWQCTTCAACMKECPITIEHIPPIIGMRRSLVMMESNFPQLLQTAFSSLETNASPWAFSQAERADWAEGTGVQTVHENPEFEYLFWVGCAGSFDDRAKKVSVAFAKLLQRAGVNFAILGTEEQCNGDLARRTGNEYLADMLVKANIETMNSYNVKKIVTFCPHCFNTLKNEYPDFGGKYEVYHHSELLFKLIQEGKFKFKKAEGIESFAYHDSCYLGRYNNMYVIPRGVLMSIPGVHVTEAERHGDNGFCCGAGGGQMFMEETEGKRVNVERTEQMLKTGANNIALNCPFCMTMLSDGTKTLDREDVLVKDIAEILLERIEA